MNRRADGHGKRVLVEILASFFLLVTSTPAGASPSSKHRLAGLDIHVRSLLAESKGDAAQAIDWAESLAARDPGSSFALSRAARLCEAVGKDSAALDYGERALAIDSLDSDAAMLVARMRFLSGKPRLAARALTPPLRQSGAIPELFALRALAHQADRDYRAALSDLERTGPLLPDFVWIATGILAMALEDGRLDEAYAAFELANRLRPGDRTTLTLGLSLAQRMANPGLEQILASALRASVSH